ncbi:MAG: 2Fe-2S iron-sulfur cluster-binding protein [Candidatus Bathyarchaeia archaeon]
MKTLTLKIDGKEIEAEEDMTILEAAEKLGIQIPTLCHHKKLEPYGACRICSVEIETRGKSRIVAACCYPVKNDLNVTTRSPKIDKIRKTILELAAVTAGEDAMGEMRKLASEYDADLSHLRSKTPIEPTKCILCGLCVRRCIEATWDSVIGFVGRGPKRQITLYPEKASICTVCDYCHDVCPTGRITSTGPDPPFPQIDDILAGRE